MNVFYRVDRIFCHSILSLDFRVFIKGKFKSSSLLLGYDRQILVFQTGKSDAEIFADNYVLLFEMD